MSLEVNVVGCINTVAFFGAVFFRERPFLKHLSKNSQVENIDEVDVLDLGNFEVENICRSFNRICGTLEREVQILILGWSSRCGER